MVTAPLVLGLDLSLTSSGWARTIGDGADRRVVTGTLRPPGSLRAAARLSWVCTRVDSLLAGTDTALTTAVPADVPTDAAVLAGAAGSGRTEGAGRVTLVVLEGYSFGSQGRATFSVGELGGAVRLRLFEQGVPYVEVSPAVLKKFATGSGQASKDEVLLAAARRAGRLFAGSSNDEADAFWLLVAGYERLAGRGVGRRLVKVPAVQAAALEKVDWSPIYALSP